MNELLRRKYWFILLLCISICLVRSQTGKPQPAKDLRTTFYKGLQTYNQASALALRSDYDELVEEKLNREALNHFYTVIKSYPAAPEPTDSFYFFANLRVGELEHYFGNIPAALNAYNLVIKTKRSLNLPDSLLFKPLIYAGIIYYNNNSFDSAAVYFSKAEQILAANQNRLDERERLYNLQGVLNYEKGDYRQAGNYFSKAIDVLPTNQTYYRELFVNYNINLAQSLMKLKDFKAAEEIYKKIERYQVNLREINHNLGSISLAMNKPKEALAFFRKVRYESNKQIRWFANIGDAFMMLSQFDSAQNYFDKAKFSHKQFGDRSDRVGYGQSLVSSGKLALKNNQPESAVRLFQDAIHQLYPSFRGNTDSTPVKYSGAFSYTNLFEALLGKAAALTSLYDQSQQTKFANLAIGSYESAFALTTYVERTYNSDEAKLFLEGIKYEAHSKPIDLAYRLFVQTKDKEYLKKLYLFDQQNKASVLSMNAAEREGYNSDSNAQGIARLKSAITRLSLKATQENDSLKQAGYIKEIRDKELDLEKIVRLTKVSNVDPGSIPRISSLQDDLLVKGTIILSYHFSDSNLTTIAISKNSFDVSQKPLNKTERKQLLGYIKQTTERIPKPANQPAFLYDLLFGGISLQNIERMIIIPDDERNYLSFETIKDQENKYLIEKFAIQYQYSTALLRLDKNNYAGHSTLGFAPFANQSYEVVTLKFARLPESMNELTNLEGRAYLDASATKNQFVTNIGSGNIIHLATHAVISDTSQSHAFIAFNPSQHRDKDSFLLYEGEIYNLPMDKTSMVILSACESGAGELVKGEGVMSLSRAFTYAGCPNVLTTLWKADDFSTAYITSGFHKYLNESLTPDLALRKAKLEYLGDRKIHPRLKQPYYWAHLIYIGNYQQSASDVAYWWLVGLVAALSIIGYFFLKRGKNTTKP